MRRLLVVDDDAFVLKALTAFLERRLADADVAVEAFADPRAALKRAANTAFDAVVADYRMPAMDGVAFLCAMRDLQPDAVRLMLTTTADFDAVQAAINRAQIFRYVTKPWDAQLADVMRDAFVRHDRDGEMRGLAELQRRDGHRPTARDLELRRLEALEPGITHVDWGPDGSVLLQLDAA
jgi:DNA-binding NtrC family response regulator